MKKYLIFLLLTLIFFTACETEINTQESSIWERRQVNFSRITTNNTPVRAGLGNNFEIVRELEEGQEVNVIAETGDWYVVQLEDNSLGSVNEKNAEPIVKPEEEVDDEEEVEDAPEGTMEEAEEEITGINNSSNEQQMVEMVNQARSENNVTALTVEPKLTQIARKKSADMVENNYFSHHSPTYGSPFDMLDHFEIEYLHAGENIAANPSVENAHTSLMESTGHRRNILNENYTHVGIGIVSSRQHGYMITQIFISKPN